MSEPGLEIEDWIEAGRTDVHLWALRGLGVDLHEAQVEVQVKVLEGGYQFYLLTWANRAGKTTGLGIMHKHWIYYKHGVPRARTEAEHEEWLKVGYRTLHCSPLNELAGRAYTAWTEIVKGVSPAQRVDPQDPSKGFRPSPLAEDFSLTKERDDAGADRMILRCVSGGVTDFRSTEGKAARLGGGAWRLITWDEWPSQENKDDIRTVLFVVLTNRAADFDAPIVLTGTITEDTEHIAQEFLDKCDDPENGDWWGNHADRSMNPGASTKAIERAQRSLDPQDYARTVMGQMGGVKGRLLPKLIIDPVFRNDLPRWTGPHPGDRATFDPEHKRFRPAGESPWTYLHCVDVALSVADNVITTLRLPADYMFSVAKPIVGVSQKIIPGSRTLTSDEIIHTIEETYLPYGGLIVVDTTDAHGKNIARSLRVAHYPVEDFTFNERDKVRNIIRKDQAVINLREVLTDGMAFVRGPDGEIQYDSDGVPRFDAAVPFGALRLPASWTKTKDQLSILREDDQRQVKDCAMTIVMGGDVAFRRRRSRTRRNLPVQRLPVFAGGRRYVEARH
jgi:hypothetical protein